MVIIIDGHQNVRILNVLYNSSPTVTVGGNDGGNGNNTDNGNGGGDDSNSSSTIQPLTVFVVVATLAAMIPAITTI